MRGLQINITGRGQTYTHTHMDIATLWVTRPRGPSQWKSLCRLFVPYYTWKQLPDTYSHLPNTCSHIFYIFWHFRNTWWHLPGSCRHLPDTCWINLFCTNITPAYTFLTIDDSFQTNPDTFLTPDWLLALVTGDWGHKTLFCNCDKLWQNSKTQKLQW